MHTKNRRSAPSIYASFALLTLLLCLLAAVPVSASERNSEPNSEEPAKRNPPAVQIGRPSGLEPPDQASMTAWHKRYAPLARPVKRTLRDVLTAREREGGPSRMERPCRALGSAVAEFKRQAAERRVFPVADSAVDIHFKRLYLRLGDVAEACADGRWAETEEGLRRFGLAYRQAEMALGRWGFSP